MKKGGIEKSPARRFFQSPAMTAIFYYTFFVKIGNYAWGYKLKSIKVSEAVYQNLKKISTNDKLTISEAVEKLLSTIPLRGCGRSGGNQDQESNSTFYRIPVENGGGKVEYVTREEFTQTIEKMWNAICDWTEKLLQNLERVGIDLNDAQEAKEED